MRPITCPDTGETCLTYEQYLRSRHWQRLRVAWQRSGRPCCCAMCESPRFDLHHVTYERIGREPLDDLVPLCPVHHGAIHAASARISGNVAAELTRKRRKQQRHRRKRRRRESPSLGVVGTLPSGARHGIPRPRSRDAEYDAVHAFAAESERRCRG